MRKRITQIMKNNKKVIKKTQNVGFIGFFDKDIQAVHDDLGFCNYWRYFCRLNTS